jgi:hypothetical protein
MTLQDISLSTSSWALAATKRSICLYFSYNPDMGFLLALHNFSGRFCVSTILLDSGWIKSDSGGGYNQRAATGDLLVSCVWLRILNEFARGLLGQWQCRNSNLIASHECGSNPGCSSDTIRVIFDNWVQDCSSAVNAWTVSGAQPSARLLTRT